MGNTLSHVSTKLREACPPLPREERVNVRWVASGVASSAGMPHPTCTRDAAVATEASALVTK